MSTGGMQALGMHDRKDAGHEEYMPEGMQGIKNARQDRGTTRGIYHRRGARHEECKAGGVQVMMTEGMQGMKNARQDRGRK